MGKLKIDHPEMFTHSKHFQFHWKAINGDASGADRHRLAGRHIGKLAGRQDIKSLRQSEQCKKAGHGKQGGP